jgi:hypothetical protein
VKSSLLKAREIEALTFIYTPTERPAGPGAARNSNTTARRLARPLVGAAVALVVFLTLAWILTPR